MYPAPFGCGLTSRGAKRTVRYEKEKNAFKPHFVRSLARSAPLPGCGLPSVEKKKKKNLMREMWPHVQPASCDICAHMRPQPPIPSPATILTKSHLRQGVNVRLILTHPPQICVPESALKCVQKLYNPSKSAKMYNSRPQKFK